MNKCPAQSHPILLLQSKYVCTVTVEQRLGKAPTLVHAFIIYDSPNPLLPPSRRAGSSLSACLNQEQNRLCPGPWEQKAVEGFGILRATRLT
jgi:hypothetical protein